MGRGRVDSPPPGVFLRKNVILGELDLERMQECDSKEFAGFAAMFTKDGSTDYLICQ
jgi:hypothetical protein